MKLAALCVSLPKPIPDRGDGRETGIFKSAVSGPIWLRRINLDGDGQADRVNHGGVDKAAYAYPAVHYAAWNAELGADLPYGQFGENFTVAGLDEDTVHVGDRFRIGSAEVEATQPRIPCFKLGIRMGSPAFPKRFLQSERTGFYLRVVQEGAVAAGDPIERTHRDPAALSIRAVLRLMYPVAEDAVWRAGLERAIAIPGLSEAWREEFRTQLK